MDGWASGPVWKDEKIRAPIGIWSPKHSARSESLYWLRHPTRRLNINPWNAELNPICHLLALLGAHHILHVSRISVNASKSKFWIEVRIISYLLTYSMEQRPSWKANWFLQLVKNFPAFLEPEGSSPYPQAPATCPYPEPTPSSPNNSLPPPEDQS